ncbi:MAG TPA: CCA tRNA nucleotidyltransferase [Paracoccaceae bacterium]|nr:CCA tRNA nucleotidyltransferase [Paracoccaceae bacterium]
MRIAADWLTAAATRAVMAALGHDGATALFVGGCVRNTILGEAAGDIDIATDLLPEEVMARAGAAGLRAVPTGIAHGTVTVVAKGRGFEVTTFRRDVETDGRRARVAFTSSLREDAERRDFTMNALYAGPDGTLVDPVGGLADLLARRVRFVGDPDARIREDYLRILRFFRFHAWHGDPAEGIDPDGLAACAANLDGLARLSRERIGHETRKLLAAPDPAPAVAAMRACGVLAAVLPGAEDGLLASLVHIEAAEGIAPNWLRRLRLLTAEDQRDALRLSNAEAAAFAAIGRALAAPEPPAIRAHRHGEEAARDAILIEAAGGAPLPPGWQAELARGGAARFPLSAGDLMPPLAPGPEIGAALAGLREDWIASGFTLDRAALLARLEDRGPEAQGSG